MSLKMVKVADFMLHIFYHNEIAKNYLRKYTSKKIKRQPGKIGLCIGDRHDFIVWEGFERQTFLDHWGWVQVEIGQKLKLTISKWNSEKEKSRKKESFQRNSVLKILYIENIEAQISTEHDPHKICKQALQILI